MLLKTTYTTSLEIIHETIALGKRRNALCREEFLF